MLNTRSKKWSPQHVARIKIPLFTLPGLTKCTYAIYKNKHNNIQILSPLSSISHSGDDINDVKSNIINFNMVANNSRKYTGKCIKSKLGNTNPMVIKCVVIMLKVDTSLRPAIVIIELLIAL